MSKNAWKTFALYAPDELELAFKDISESVYDGIELSVDEAKNMRKVKALSKRYGLQVACVTSGFMNNSDSVNNTKKAIDLCNSLDVDYTLYLPPVKSSFSWQQFIANTRDLCKYADEKGVVPTVHHHTGTLVETLEDAERFLHDVDMENLGICFDTAHAELFSDPEGWINSLGESIKYVHVKDLAKIKGDLKIKKDQVTLGSKNYLSIATTFTDLGAGAIKFKSIFNALKKNRYDGWFSVEMEIQRVSRKEHLRKNLSILKIYS
jgi:sugar phosphate isomerase/epimerase